MPFPSAKCQGARTGFEPASCNVLTIPDVSTIPDRVACVCPWQTMSGTGFDWHRDTEPWPTRKSRFTVIVRLTSSIPSSMVVCGCAQQFVYGVEIGDCAVFASELVHASVRATHKEDLLKVAFFVQ